MNMRTLILGATLALAVGAPAAQDGDNQAMTEKQRLSYALGAMFAQGVAQQGLDLDNEHFLEAVRDLLHGKAPRLSQQEIQDVLTQFQQQEQEQMTKTSDENLRAGQEFLARNKTAEGVVTLDSGLQYKVLEAGAGDSPKADSKVVVHYRGTLLDGTEFDSSYARGEPITLGLDRVIRGWQEALPLMKIGSRWRLYIPPDLAYGPNGTGSIGPNETLIFEVELLEIQ